ncbi:MAG: hypothetical protein KatS3mg028_1568 [Bacteroidia bacterium]|nr:MAG: hypothetical protein KatS3mg028_1568 [Bacteroidia bacterium]
MDNQISAVTRKDLFDEIKEKGYWWHGRLDEIDFLKRICNLKEMKSTDSRFKNAEDDIWQHRENNFDWEDWWILSDSRFDLLHCPDEDFFKFICEMIHPYVRNEKEVNEILPIMNKYLRRDNFELYPESYISGRPVFGYRKIDIAKEKVVESVKTITNYLTTEYIESQIKKIEDSIDKNPADAIGTAKELVETICKAILDKNKVQQNDKDNLSKLVKETLSTLNLMPEQIPEDKKGAESIKKIIGGLQSIVHGLAELRNHYGSGHGKSPDFKGLQSRHAKLATGAASTVVFFLLEAHQAQHDNNNKQKNHEN